MAQRARSRLKCIESSRQLQASLHLGSGATAHPGDLPQAPHVIHPVSNSYICGPSVVAYMVVPACVCISGNELAILQRQLRPRSQPCFRGPCYTAAAYQTVLLAPVGS